MDALKSTFKFAVFGKTGSSPGEEKCDAENQHFSKPDFGKSGVEKSGLKTRILPKN